MTEKLENLTDKMREVEDSLALMEEPQKSAVVSNLRRELEIDHEG